MFKLRDYQEKATEKAIDFLRNGKGHGLEVLPTGSGKSLIIANIVHELSEPTLILQPSKEILEQNFQKMCSYGHSPSIYSASLGQKNISELTFATIGSIVKTPELFSQFKKLIIDECDLVNPKEGMYKTLIKTLEEQQGIRALGLTATPYRLSGDMNGAILKFITRTRPKMFSKLLYNVQTSELFDRGYLSPLIYHRTNIVNPYKIKPNSTGADYDSKSYIDYFADVNMTQLITEQIRKQLNRGRKHILVFTRFVNEAEQIVHSLSSELSINFVSGETPTKERERILSQFKSGEIKVVVNVGVLTVGFDFPQLDTIILGRLTKSLRLFYQMVGRGMRIHETKPFCLIVDMVNNLQTFGRIEDLVLTTEKPNSELYCIYSKTLNRQLTNTYF